MNKKRILLFNPWTNALHGHARNELNIAKNLYKEAGVNSEIISLNENYGDIFIETSRSFISKLPSVIKRGVIYKQSKKTENKVTAKSLNVFLKEVRENSPVVLVITSCKPSDLAMFDHIDLQNIDLRIRLISPPVKMLEIKIFKRLLSRSNVLICFETTDGTIEAKKYVSVNLFTVPPIQALAPIKSDDSDRKVGIYWPVAYFEEEIEVRNLLRIFSNESCIIRLPGNVRQSIFGEEFPQNIYVERGISDSLFYKYVENTKLAILPHKGYKLRGSGLAAIFAGLGIPILADKENSFFPDIEGKSPIWDLPTNIKQRNWYEALSMNKNYGAHRNSYREWSLSQWQRFLNGVE